MSSKRKALYVDETNERAGGGAFQPVLVVEDEPGYYQTGWNYGPSYEEARRQVDEYNEQLGLSRQDVLAIVASSIRASNADNGES